MTPRVTVVIPTRNEAADIGACLTAVGAQDHPLEDIEVIVVDGASDDGTAEVSAEFLSTMSFGRTEVIRNADATTPSNLNCGLAAAGGDYLVRVDARSIIPPHYVRTVVGVLSERPEVAVVGGAQRAVARDRSPMAIGIARALNNRWSTGFARYRRTDVPGPADTVYLGAFRTGELRDAGGWDVRFPTNQDFELNRRMGNRGLVWFVGGLPVAYRPRASLADLWRQYVRFGRWKAIYWSTTGDAPRLRQRIMVLGPIGLASAVLGGCALARSSKPAVLAAGLGAGGLVAVELFGAEEPRADARGHLAGVAAVLVVSGAWLAGVYEGVLRTAVERGRGAPPQGAGEQAVSRQVVG